MRNPTNRLKLGGNTTLSGALSYLQIDSQTNGVHVTEATATQIWLDTPTTVSAAFTAAGGFNSTGNMSVSGNLAVSGTTTLQGLTAQAAATFQSTVSTGALTASQATVTGTSALQGAVTASSTINVQGAAQFQSTVSTGALTAAALTVNGTTALTGAATLASTLAVSGATTLAAVTASGAANLNTLSTTGAATLGSTLSVTGNSTMAGNLTVSGTTGVNVTAGNLQIKAATITYDTTTAGFENLNISTNGTSAVRIYNSDQHVSFSGGIVGNSLTAQAGQPLVLTGSDTSSTVKIAGNLQVAGSINETNVNTLNVNDLNVTVAHSNTTPQADSLADGAGLIVEGNSGYAKSLIWHYNSGLAYKPASSSQATGDGLSYWEVRHAELACAVMMGTIQCLPVSITCRSMAEISACQELSQAPITFPIARLQTLGQQTTHRHL